jgi:hypothetical protein
VDLEKQVSFLDFEYVEIFRDVLGLLFPVRMLRTVLKSHIKVLLIKNGMCCSGGMNGFLHMWDGECCPPVFKSPLKDMPHINNNEVLYVPL